MGNKGCFAGGLAASLALAGAASMSCDTGTAGRPTVDGVDGGGMDTSPGTGPDPSCSGPPTMSASQDAIFSKSCAFTSCHGGANPAAGLNLTAGYACASLVQQPSCVFSDRTLVVPGQPEKSYLVHAIAGDDLGTNPDGTCAGLTNGTPARMPLGGQPLCQGQIDQVQAWIAAGAACDTAAGGDAGTTDTGSGDAGLDGSVDAPNPIDAPDAPDAPNEGGDASDGGNVSPDIAHLTSAMTSFEAGQSIAGSVVLAEPAPAAGVAVTLVATDPTVIAVPTVVFVPSGQTMGSFEMMGMRPGRAAVEASAGGKGASLDELVVGLQIAEVFYSGLLLGTDGAQWVRLYNATTIPINLSSYSLGGGVNSYVETTVQLSGVVAPHACFVVGGPTSSFDNGYPTFTQVAHFRPNLAAANSGGAGVALFGVSAANATATTVPVDAVVWGSTNSGKLLGPNGTVAPAVLGGDVLPGDSLMLQSGSWIDQYPPEPATCGP
jgi:hypothetical protein